VKTGGTPQGPRFGHSLTICGSKLYIYGTSLAHSTLESNWWGNNVGGLAAETVVVNELSIFDTGKEVTAYIQFCFLLISFFFKESKKWLTLDKPRGATPKQLFLHSSFVMDSKLYVFGGWEEVIIIVKVNIKNNTSMYVCIE